MEPTMFRASCHSHQFDNLNDLRYKALVLVIVFVTYLYVYVLIFTQADRFWCSVELRMLRLTTNSFNGLLMRNVICSGCYA